jgi:hypothetical protein
MWLDVDINVYSVTSGQTSRFHCLLISAIALVQDAETHPKQNIKSFKILTLYDEHSRESQHPSSSSSHPLNLFPAAFRPT